ncbi:LOB domain-containing protein 30 [Camellia lanceoleosa]|nr:LOB domain-containing protein 30 [Camellia lanceoleosa]
MTSNPSTTSSRGTTTTTTTTSGGGRLCGICKFFRRKCVASCIFAPYFDSEQGAAHFVTVYMVFGASNVSKLLYYVSANKWLDAVFTICYEAQARRRDPVYGCVAHIFALHQQVHTQSNLKSKKLFFGHQQQVHA